jgi:AcrR family transcriptional regulator
MTEKTGRRERKREQTRRIIAESAMRLFVERGFDAVTIAEVAEAADVAVNTVFNHFPTKEDLFFGSRETMETELTGLARSRHPGESVIAFFRRSVHECIEQLSHEGRGSRADHAYWAGVRQVLHGSQALQVRAAQMARGSAMSAEDDLAASLAEDVAAKPDDPTPRLVASQVLALYSSLLMEAERRRRAGQSREKVRAYFKSAAEVALRILEHGLGDYGSRRT